MAIEPDSTAERKKLADKLEMLKRQDPTFSAVTNEETGQTIISGMGELHLEIIKNRLLRDFKLKVKVHKPRVSYRESVGSTVEVTGERHRNVAGQQHMARVKVRIEPFNNKDKPIVAFNSLPATIPPVVAVAIIETLAEQTQGRAFPLLNAKITALDAETTDTEPDEITFRMAAADAFRQALEQSQAVLLEPIMDLEVNVPDDFVGEITGDLMQRRAQIRSTNMRGKNTVVSADVPLANMFGYSGAMRSLSQGRASCSMEPSTYAPAPPDIRAQFLGI